MTDYYERQFTPKELTQLKNNLYTFYRWFVVSNFEENLTASHIKYIAYKLMQLVNGTLGKSRIGINLPPQHKLADSTPVLTDNRGWVTHGDLTVGDTVFTPNGNPSPVVNVSDKDYCDYKITFSDGSTILAHHGHLWSVYKRGHGKKQSIHTTEEIMKDYVYYEGDTRRYRYQLPLIQPIEFNNNRELPIDPYWLGLWLGDGTHNKPCITHDPEDNEWIEHIPYHVSSVTIHKKTGVHTTYFGNQDLTGKLRELHVYENKHIPEIYFTASVPDRLKLLAGLIDSDGSVDQNGRVRFINTNKKLIDGFARLCDSLALYHGKIHHITADEINRIKSEKKYGLPIVSKKDCYVLGFQATYPIPTHIPRKQCNGKGLRRRLSIIRVEKVDNGEMGKCIEIADPEGIYLAGERLTPTHNSKSSLITEAFTAWLLLNNPKRRILVVNAEKGLSQKFGTNIKNLLRNAAPFWGLQISNDSHSKTSMKLTKDGDLQSGSIDLTGLTGGITGRPVDYIICDDLFKGLPTELTPTGLDTKWDLYNIIIEQRMRTKNRSKLVLLSTRWDSEDIHGRILADDYQKQKYEFIILPAIAGENDILGRKPGEPLWPEYYDLNFYHDKERTMGERQFQAIYQQVPLDLTGDFFYTDHLHWDDTYIDQDNIANCRSYDMAYTDEKTALAENRNADYTAGCHAEKISDKHYIFSDFLYKRLGAKNIRKIQSTARFDGLNKPILIEPGTKGGAASELFRLWDKDYLTDYNCIQSEPIGTKADRATALKNAIYDGYIHIYCPDTALRKELKIQLESFPNGSAHKDLIDAMAHAFNYLKDKSDGGHIRTGSKRRRRSILS